MDNSECVNCVWLLVTIVLWYLTMRASSWLYSILVWCFWM